MKRVYRTHLRTIQLPASTPKPNVDLPPFRVPTLHMSITPASQSGGGKHPPSTEDLTTIGSPFDKMIASCKSESFRLPYQFNYLTYQWLAMKPSNPSNPQPTVDLLRCRARSTQMSKYVRIPFSLSISRSLCPRLEHT